MVTMATESSHGGEIRCLRVFSVNFNQIFVKLAGNEDRHKISDEFDFVLDRTFHYKVIRP